MQFAMRDIGAEFLLRHPKVNVVAHATDQNVDIVGENYDVAIRAHTDPLPDSTLVQRTLTPAPWFLFAGSAYLDANETPQTPQDLRSHPSLFMMRSGLAAALPFPALLLIFAARLCERHLSTARTRHGAQRHLGMRRRVQATPVVIGRAY